MPETSTEPPRHQSGGLAVALAKLNLDALTVSDAVADVASMAGENVTTALRSDFKELRADVNGRLAETDARVTELRADMNARIDTLTSETNARFADTNARIDILAGAVQSLQREITGLRWMIGSGFTLLGVILAIATFVLRGSS